MAPETEDNPPKTALKAEYSAPTSSKAFSHPLPPASTSSTEEKTAYLSALRESVTKLQEELNTFLTGKMEEDKALAVAAGSKVDDKREEENYGEEGGDEEG